MRPGGTQTKHGAAVRMRRRLGLAPRACVLLSCSLVLVIAGVSAYGMTVPSMVQAHAARELHIGRKAKSDLGTTTGYTWASVVSHVVFGVDPADEGEAPDNEVTLANGKTIVLTNTKIITKLSNNSVASVINKAEQQKSRMRSSREAPAARMHLARDLLVRVAIPMRVPAQADLRAAARQAVAPAATRTRVASRLPRKKASTAVS
ncbi:MAG: hypothetical protein ACLU37_07390 [Collinsella sp.]